MFTISSSDFVLNVHDFGNISPTLDFPFFLEIFQDLVLVLSPIFSLHRLDWQIIIIISPNIIHIWIIKGAYRIGSQYYFIDILTMREIWTRSWLNRSTRFILSLDETSRMEVCSFRTDLWKTFHRKKIEKKLREELKAKAKRDRFFSIGLASLTIGLNFKNLNFWWKVFFCLFFFKSIKMKI